MNVSCNFKSRMATAYRDKAATPIKEKPFPLLKFGMAL
jgi:hypothetical protein